LPCLVDILSFIGFERVLQAPLGIISVGHWPMPATTQSQMKAQCRTEWLSASALWTAVYIAIYSW